MAPEETQYFHYDGRGSVVMQMNEAGQYETEQLVYPWGQAWEGDATGQPGYSAFASMEEGGVSGGLDLTPNRAYGSTQGRWLSPDPMGGDLTNPQSLNRYAYVLNNPMSLVDPMGLGPCGNLQYGQGKGQCLNGAVGVALANSALGAGGWDEFSLIGIPVVDPSQYGWIPFNGSQYPGPTWSWNSTAGTGTGTSTLGITAYWGPLVLGDAFTIFSQLPEVASTLAPNQSAGQIVGPAAPRSNPPPDSRPSCGSVFWDALSGQTSPASEPIQQGAQAASTFATQTAWVYAASKTLSVPLRSPYFRLWTNAGEFLGSVAEIVPAAFGAYDLVKAEYPAMKANVTGQCQNNFW